jgi:hypothetical protein
MIPERGQVWRELDNRRVRFVLVRDVVDGFVTIVAAQLISRLEFRRKPHAPIRHASLSRFTDGANHGYEYLWSNP